jgi:gliding motility-associated-like protein/uncharacterized repeat protein (TIGR01451 family)
MRKNYTFARTNLPASWQQRAGLAKNGTHMITKFCLFLLFFIAGLAWMPAKASYVASIELSSASSNPTGTNGSYKGNDPITYIIKVQNTGLTTLTNVMVVDTLPAYTTFSGSSEGVGVTPGAGGRIDFNIGDILPGVTYTITLSVRVTTASLAGVGYIKNSAYVNVNDGSGYVGIPAAGQGAFTYPTIQLPVDNGINALAWMAVSYTGSTSGGSASAGSILTYTVRVRNSSATVALSNVTITAQIPNYTAFVKADDGYTQAGNVLTFPIASIAGGATVTFSYQVRVSTDLTGISAIPNTAFVNINDGKGNVRTYPAADGNPSEPKTVAGNAGNSTSVPVESKTDYATWMIVLNENGLLTVSPSDVLTYYIYVHNTGSMTIPSLNVSNTVPSGTDFAKGYDEFLYNQQSSTVFWTISNLVAGATSTVRYSVKVADNLSGYKTIQNTGKVEVKGDSSRLTMNCNPDDDGCEKAYITSIDVKGDRPGLFVSNVVTPNGDGKNDYFYIRNLEDFPQSKVYIFNRWGAQVYFSNDYQNDWKATGLAEGTYFYRIDLNKEGTITTYKGWVMIIR